LFAYLRYCRSVSQKEFVYLVDVLKSIVAASSNET